MEGTPGEGLPAAASLAEHGGHQPPGLQPERGRAGGTVRRGRTSRRPRRLCDLEPRRGSWQNAGRPGHLVPPSPLSHVPPKPGDLELALSTGLAWPLTVLQLDL